MRNMVSQGAQRLEPSLIRTVLDRAAALRSEGHRVIPFSAGEPNFNTPSPIKAAAQKAIEENFTHYTSNRGLPGLRTIIAKMMEQTTGTAYDPETEIIVTSSGAEALNNAIHAFVGQGDEVIIPTPAFVSYKNLVKFTGAEVVEVPLSPKECFRLDAKAIQAKITPKTKMIILNNPNNPSGAVYTREDLEAVAKLAVEHDLLVLSDEMYSRLVYDGAEFVSVTSLPGMRERAIVVSGFSKSYAMTGWRLGYLIADKALVSTMLKVHQYSTTCSPTFIQKGLVDSLEDLQTEKEVQDMLAAFAQRRKAILAGLEKIPGLTPITPRGAFYVTVDVSATGMNGMDFATRLLEEKYVATVPAAAFDGDTANLIRISYAASDEDIQEGLKRLEDFVKGLK
ncbi:pyridoxal phosphate-dependent aminotransferase [Flintibacter muris]|uniref:pyridoxal phosphate-dependent aminotransferase n=1 Tax=Flintibacter muris TaxID=2941327 RepID=UPI00203ECE6B|nr:pyridoxal phosphate-dependent aminotransferase [Flintibacter muris]